jgi:hypothetical protein
MPRARKALLRLAISSRNSVARTRPSKIVAGIAQRVRADKEPTLERVHWNVQLGGRFDEYAFEEAFTGFRRLYHIRPERVLCAPDVLARYALLYSRSVEDAHSGHALRYDDIPLESAILAPGTIIFEGEVDEEQMGDW